MGRRVRVKPVAQLLIVPRPEASLGIPLYAFVQPESHCIIRVTQDLLIARRLIKISRDGDHRLTPDRLVEAPQRFERELGYDDGYYALPLLLLLSEAQVLHPIAQESSPVQEIAEYRSKDRNIAGPAQSLVSLGRVGRDRNGVEEGVL